MTRSILLAALLALAVTACGEKAAEDVYKRQHQYHGLRIQHHWRTWRFYWAKRNAHQTWISFLADDSRAKMVGDG